MMKINICYVDDTIDNRLNRYLVEYCEQKNESSQEFVLNAYESQFLAGDDYKTLLQNPKVNSANILLIDSRLFENETSGLSKFTGEQFKIILRKVYPFIKTIVISQNEANAMSKTICKYKSSVGADNRMEAKRFYDTSLAPILQDYIFSTIEEYNVLEEIKNERAIDPVLVSNIQSAIDGISSTDLLEKKDLDVLIDLFNEVKNNYE
ncbi:hypothetical protein [Exiguobacterium artemiae]|uniref:hypothetical protein n=1 Tax=Exiguobacterium artemiae TaxID=340145 RepID=UPI003D08B2B3